MLLKTHSRKKYIVEINIKTDFYNLGKQTPTNLPLSKNRIYNKREPAPFILFAQSEISIYRHLEYEMSTLEASLVAAKTRTKQYKYFVLYIHTHFKAVSGILGRNRYF